MRDATPDAIRRILSGRTKQTVDNPSLRPAAVLFLLYPKDGQCHILFNRRSLEVEHHKGEISFPGGALDGDDADMLACALRETWEEMGVRPQDVTILGELDTVATRSQFAIHTYVGTIPYPYPFRVSRKEVAEVLEVPLSVLQDPRSHREEVYLSEDGGLVRLSAYAYNHHLIYGATGRIVTQFLGLLNGFE